MKNVICVCGPTASGKTGAASYIARELGGEVINADSVQIFSGLDIGSAMPREEEKLGVPHHLFGFLQPGEAFSAGEYQPMARTAIEDVHARGKLPVLAGGTGLYIDAALYPMEFSGSRGGGEYREELQRLAGEKGAPYIWKLLFDVDPETAARLSENDLKRTIRALEIYNMTGRTMSSSRVDYRSMPLYNVLFVGLNMDRDALYARIGMRVDMMMEKGLLDEAKSVYESLGGRADSLKAIGYKELFAYFRGETALPEAVELIKKNTRNYAKRQITWFRRCPGITWFGAGQPETLEEIKNFAIKWLETGKI